MASDHRRWTRQGEAFWRAHHEAWKRSDLNQRRVLRGAWPAAEGFRELASEVQSRTAAAKRKLLYRRRGLSPPLVRPLVLSLSPMSYP